MLAAESIHTIELPKFSSKEDTIVSVRGLPDKSPRETAQLWLDKLSAVLARKDTSQLSSVLHQDSWWRDALAVSWDLRTAHGLPNIVKYVSGTIDKVGFTNFRLVNSGKFAPSEVSPIEGLDWIEFMFSFDTAVGHGKGMARLAITPNTTNEWKAHMLYTSLQELKGFPEATGERRPHGGNNSLKGGVAEGNWYDRRERQIEFLDEDPSVIIIGAGQAGLNTAARLQTMGISALLVDKNERIGDNWRHRYRTLVTHDPVTYTHMAYLPFPSNWPLFTPKDKLADWFEAYASLMELNVWLKSTIVSADYSDDNKQWSMVIRRGDGTERRMRARHLVFCTGHAGEARIPTFPGQSSFKGTVYHGSQHRDATVNGAVAGKKVVVVGTGNSGHDIAQNYYEAGASVEILQRSGTYVISAKTGLFMLHAGLYDEHSPPLEDADVYGQSLPIPVQFALNVGATEAIRNAEKENLDGLIKAGFKLDFGSDGSGIYRKYVTRGGGYYIDVGASQLIIDGKIKVVQSPDGIKGFEEHALVLADGRKLDADIVVLATGYDNMKTTARKALGDRVADRCKDVWDLDEEGEINAMWRPSGHPRLWFMGGSLALCRIYSKFLALQIKAVEEGLSSA